MEPNKQSFPLSWPVGYKRTDNRLSSGFKRSPEDAITSLKSELAKIGAKNIIISSNAAVKTNGEIYADAMGRLADPGVAVYFDYKKNHVVLCCDTFEKVWENVNAIARTLQSLRTIDRYGVSDFLNRSFTGFAALPEPIATPYKREWWVVLGVPPNASASLVRDAFKIKVKMVHPDMGGSVEAFNELQRAFDEALKEFEK
jgi:hypothetical protein